MAAPNLPRIADRASPGTKFFPVAERIAQGFCSPGFLIMLSFRVLLNAAAGRMFRAFFFPLPRSVDSTKKKLRWTLGATPALSHYKGNDCSRLVLKDRAAL
jgi:di/tricarboxylate transporter